MIDLKGIKLHAHILYVNEEQGEQLRLSFMMNVV